MAHGEYSYSTDVWSIKFKDKIHDDYAFRVFENHKYSVIDPSIENLVGYFETEKVALHARYALLLGSAQTDEYVLKQEYLNMKDKKYASMSAQAGYIQLDYYAYDPAFATQQTTSSDARVQAEVVMNAIFVGNYTVEEAIEDMMYQLGAK
mgnify:CR=1 FL=1